VALSAYQGRRIVEKDRAKLHSNVKLIRLYNEEGLNENFVKYMCIGWRRIRLT